MSYLTPSKLPIGYNIDRPTAERGYDKATLPKLGHIPKSKLEIPFLAVKFFGKKSVVLETEGLGSQSFHGRVVILVNEHTTGAARWLSNSHKRTILVLWSEVKHQGDSYPGPLSR
jgi:hypothetical protein